MIFIGGYYEFWFVEGSSCNNNNSNSCNNNHSKGRKKVPQETEGARRNRNRSLLWNAEFATT